jgi:KUP system potassium uptake protein
LGALGVVYGDIGTSPLYALRECFDAKDALALTEANVLGILSLIFWSLMLVVTVKYLVLIMRADNNGEGGILALLTLVRSHTASTGQGRATLIVLGLFGAALLYGDGMITPAISILSAMEGLQVAAPGLEPYVAPLAILVLAALFSIQKRGTGVVGVAFGPITLAWFLCLGTLGASWIIREPRVLLALSPHIGFDFMLREGFPGFLALGGVFLVVTGGEALYADMGHFGKLPIRVAWTTLVLPALVLNYMGQGALLLTQPEAIDNPFYHMAPGWALYPLIGLATAATAVASQAVLSGAFSLTNQALLLDYIPRLDVKHTSAREAGQIYVPFVNWALFFSTVILVIEFETSSALAGAYGIAVSATMVITSLLAYFCARRVWGWSMPVALAVWGAAFLIDASFFAANGAKLAEGGWVPVVVAAVILALMTTWRDGRALLESHVTLASIPFDLLFADMDRHHVPRVPGTVVYMDRQGEGVPRTLFHNLKHNKVVHEKVITLTVVTEDVPRVPEAQRLEVSDLSHGFVRIVVHTGFMEMLNVPEVLEQAAARGANFTYDPMQTTFVLGRETLIPARKQMSAWRARLFSFISRSSQRATIHFGIPPNRVIEIGSQVDL